MKFIYTVLLAAVVFFSVTYLAKRFLEPESQAARLDASSSGESPGDLLAYERNTTTVFQQASPAVVFVHNLKMVRNFFTWDVSEVNSGAGSGFLWDERGHIVTNYHVVQGADRVAVTLIDGNTYEARKVGIEPRKDLAVLKIDLQETNVKPFSEKVADSSKIMVGQKAIAIGNPYGLDHTLTVGTVSSLGRSMSSIVEGVTIRDMIQTDAPINPGNSGGPLLDSRGRLIGMNTLILKGSTGIGFAVPSNSIRRIVDQIIRYGQAVQLGIGLSIFEDRVAKSLRVDGVIVREVYRNSPAAAAGLKGTTRDRYGRIVIGDIVLAIDGERIRNYDDMYNAFDQMETGQNIEVTYYRDGEEFTKSIEVIIVNNLD